MILDLGRKQQDGLWWHLLKRGVETRFGFVFGDEEEGFSFGLVRDSC